MVRYAGASIDGGDLFLAHRRVERYSADAGRRLGVAQGVVGRAGGEEGVGCV